MNFTAIASGTSIFLDANVFVYAFGPDPAFGDACTQLLERIETKDLLGFVSAAELSDIAHRLMTLEACETFHWPYAGVAARLRKRPEEIRKLVRFRHAIAEVEAMGVRVLDVSSANVLRAGDLSIQHGLLSGDALIVAVMQSHGLSAIASNDADFDRVSGIVRYTPV